MADYPQGYLSVDGIDNVLSFSFTRGHGIQPGVASLRVSPQEDDFPTGPVTMTLTFGDDVEITFPDCVIDKASIKADPGSPQIVSLAVKDRRWVWQYGEITGRYNLRLSDGTIDLATQQTTQQLAILLLEAMEEEDYDVSALNTAPYPEVNWDYSNPAEELEHLAESLGCHVVLQNDDSILIALVGQGNPLPDDPSARTVDFGVDPPDMPDTIKLVGGPTRYQSTFKLRAVGQEKDTLQGAQYDNKSPPNLIAGNVTGHGKIMPIENLSYMPSGGWQGEWLSGNSFGNITDLEARKCAQESIYRWYQVCQTVDQPQGLCNILGYSDKQKSDEEVIPGPVAPWQCFPLEDGLVESYVEFVAAVGNGTPSTQAASVEHPIPPRVHGNWFAENADFGINNTFRRFPYPFTIDKERGIVKFSYPVVKFTGDTTSPFVEAELYLTVGHCVKDFGTRQPDRFTTEIPTGNQAGTGPLILHREDVVRRVINGTDLSSNTAVNNPTALSDTNDSAEAEAQYYLAAYVAGLQTPRTAHVEYNGFLDISPDGAVCQVEWSGGPSGAMTKASINSEFSLHVPSYQQRREIGRVNRQSRLLNRVDIGQPFNRPARGPL